MLRAGQPMRVTGEPKQLQRSRRRFRAPSCFNGMCALVAGCRRASGSKGVSMHDVCRPRDLMLTVARSVPAHSHDDRRSRRTRRARRSAENSRVASRGRAARHGEAAERELRTAEIWNVDVGHRAAADAGRASATAADPQAIDARSGTAIHDTNRDTSPSPCRRVDHRIGAADGSAIAIVEADRQTERARSLSPPSSTGFSVSGGNLDDD